MLDRKGIRKLMLLYTQGDLCFHFGISRPTLYELMEKLSIHRPDRDGKFIEAG